MKEVIRQMTAPGWMAVKFLELICQYYEGDKHRCTFYVTRACPFNGECDGKYGHRGYPEWHEKMKELAEQGVESVPHFADGGDT